jgi:hypothetical protein
MKLFIDTEEGSLILKIAGALKIGRLQEASDYVKEFKKKTIEECAKVADHQKTICGLSMSRQSTCEDIAKNIRSLNG